MKPIQHELRQILAPHVGPLFLDQIVNQIATIILPSFSKAITCEDPDTAFAGPTYHPKHYPRLKGQKKTIRQLMSNRCWWTLRQLEERTGFLPTSISARIRELSHEKREVGRGLWEYRLILSNQPHGS